MGEGSAHRGRQTEVNRPHAAEVSRPHAEEVRRPHPVEVRRARLVELSRARHVELSSSCRAQLVSPGKLVRVDYVRPPTSEGHNSSVRTPIWVFLNSMESPLSQESIHMSEEDIRCRTKVIDRTRHAEVNSSVQSARLG